MLQYERTNAVVSLSLIGLALYFVLEFPLPELTFSLGDTVVSITSPQRGVMALLLIGLTMAGTDMVIRSHPALVEYRLGYLATFWMLPGLLVAVATQLLVLPSNLLIWGASLLGVGLLLWLTIVAEFQQVLVERRFRRWAFIWQQGMAYSLALSLIFIIYQAAHHHLLTAVLIFIIGVMLAVSLLRQNSSHIGTTWLFALTIGFALAQIAWTLTIWQSSLIPTTLSLFLLFYTMVGLARQHLNHNLSPRVLGEFALLLAVGLIVIFTL